LAQGLCFGAVRLVCIAIETMPNKEKLAKKTAYFEKLIDLCVNYPEALIVHVDHVGSKQMQDIRVALRGKGVVLMGKNSMIRKALSIGHERHPDAGMDKIRAIMVGNIGFIFATTSTLDEIREIVGQYKVMSAAKAGQQSLVDWTIPSGPTGMDPSQTSFFQALNIGTKIVKGQIELVSDYQILKVGEKVSASQQVLLGKLGIKPFEYGMVVQQVYQDASVFSAAVLDIGPAELMAKLFAGIRNMAAFSRELGIPTEAGIPHAFGNAFKNVAALVGESDFEVKELEEVKKFFADPDAYVAANPGGGGGGGSTAPVAASGGAAKAAAAPVEEEEEEDMEFDLFG
jgi:large subunit ribosomal protein LP0